MSPRPGARHPDKSKRPEFVELHLLVFKVAEEISIGGLYSTNRRAMEALELAPYPQYRIIPLVVNQHLFVQAIINQMQEADDADPD